MCPYAVFGKKDSYTEAVKETSFGEKDVDVGEKMGAITEEEFEAKKKQLLGQ